MSEHTDRAALGSGDSKMLAVGGRREAPGATVRDPGKGGSELFCAKSLQTAGNYYTFGIFKQKKKTLRSLYSLVLCWHNVKYFSGILDLST